MRIVVLGASGLLGRAVGEELVDRGHQVVAVSRSGGAGPRVAAGGTVVRADLVAATDDALDRILAGAGAAVWCLGPDDRAPLPVPIEATLERLLVDPTVRAARAARRQGVGAFVILGSYFSTLSRLHPEWGLPARHPYIAARAAQADQARAVAPERVSVVEIPFVFGAVPGVEPMWTEVLFRRLRRGPVAMTFPGGTAAVVHTDVARAVALLAEREVPPGRYPLAAANLSYRHLCSVVVAELGRRVPVVTMPAPLLTAGVRATDRWYRLRGRTLALNPRHIATDVLSRHLLLDPAGCCAPFGLTPGPVDDAIRATVRAAYPDLG